MVWILNQVTDGLKKSIKIILCRIVSTHAQGIGRLPLNIDIAPKDQKELLTLRSRACIRFELSGALPEYAKDTSRPLIASVVATQLIHDIGRRYQQGGLEAAVYERHGREQTDRESVSTIEATGPPRISTAHRKCS